MKKLAVLLLILYAISSQGDVLWKFETGGMVTGQATVHQGMIYVCGGTKLYALNEQGELQWAYDAQAPTFSSVAFKDDLIFMLADNGLHAVDRAGERLWQFDTQDGPLEVEGKTMGWGEGSFIDPWAWYRSSPIVVGDKVVFSNRQGTYALESHSGQQLWHASTGVSHTRPAHHGEVVVVGSWDNHLYGLNIEDGSKTWEVTSRLPGGAMAGWLGWEGFNLDPLIHEGVVYLGNRGTYFYAINADTGIEKWSAKHPSSWIGSPAIVSDEVVYFGTSDGYSLLGFETTAGNQTLLFRNNFYNFARPQASESHVFMASVSGELFAVEKASGKGRRIFVTESSKENFSELLSPTGGMKPFYTARDGYTHETATRDVRRMLSMLDSLLSVTLSGDVLLVGSANGSLYAVSIPGTKN